MYIAYMAFVGTDFQDAQFLRPCIAQFWYIQPSYLDCELHAQE